MLDIKLIREKTDFVKENLKKREDFDLKIIDELLEFDLKFRKAKTDLDNLKSKKNFQSKNIAENKKKGKEIEDLILDLKQLNQKIKINQEELLEIVKKRDILLRKIPNLLDKQVPIGKNDEENVKISSFGEKPNFDFKPKNHQELCELNNWYDLDIAAKNSGARFYYMKNELVLLEVALYDFVLNKLRKKGFEIMEVPVMLKSEVAKKAIPLSDFEDTIYKIENQGDDLYLIGTSEHALATYNMDQLMQEKDLPKLYAGISPCYRREAGVTKDEKGIFRVHNFNKIEQFIYCKDSESQIWHKKITDNIKEIFEDLEIHYQIVDICTGDIGIFATRKFDLEAWLPGQNRYREMGSSSNYKDYGARSLNVRYQDRENNIKFCHSLNNTAIALQRAIIAIIENHQTESGNVRIPKVLRNYFGGREFLIEK